MRMTKLVQMHGQHFYKEPLTESEARAELANIAGESAVQLEYQAPERRPENNCWVVTATWLVPETMPMRIQAMLEKSAHFAVRASGIHAWRIRREMRRWRREGGVWLIASKLETDSTEKREHHDR